MKPKTLGKLDNHGSEAWKLPLAAHIEELYLQHFGKERPCDHVDRGTGAHSGGEERCSQGSQAKPFGRPARQCSMKVPRLTLQV